MSVHSSFVDTPPVRHSTQAPRYRRFDSYDTKTDTMLNAMTETQIIDTMNSSRRAPRVRSAPQPLEFRGWHGAVKPVEESEKVRGKKRCSDPGLLHGSIIYVTNDDSPIDDDHVAPFRAKHVPRPSSSSFAGPSSSASSIRVSTRESANPQAAQLQIVEEHKELLSPVSSATPPPPSPPPSAAIITEDSDFATPSPRLLKRVSFSSAASNIVLAPPSPLSTPATPGPSRSSWSGFFRPVVARPPPVKQVYVPPARGQAAGRSILKRTSSYGDAGVREPTGVPMTEKIEIASLVPLREKAEPAGETVSAREEFMDVDLTQDSGMKMDNVASPMATRPALVRSALSYEQRAVRHWSMVGSSWVRRSGLFAQEVEMRM
ncbi:hypothetical protein DE146DRAFT_751379 [Phaeosphaeria sp. MPI-PUGE-AT-0046c]|nr:hypothetical protein DE146DRAFT_751379 [Phaeosphaeria sp. MPI-PUGE-AT-0046c]